MQFDVTSIACNRNDEYISPYILNIVVIIIMSRVHTVLLYTFKEEAQTGLFNP